jgi:hypothetical protein
MASHWAVMTPPSFLPTIPAQDTIVAAVAGQTEETPDSAPTDDLEQFQIQGLTTRPGLDEAKTSRQWPQPLPRPRALGNTALSVEEIDELFTM